MNTATEAKWYESKDFNPRYLAWQRMTGGGPSYEFMGWVVEQWAEFDRDVLKVHSWTPHSPEDHRRFDEWLIAKAESTSPKGASL